MDAPPCYHLANIWKKTVVWEHHLAFSSHNLAAGRSVETILSEFMTLSLVYMYSFDVPLGIFMNWCLERQLGYNYQICTFLCAQAASWWYSAGTASLHFSICVFISVGELLLAAAVLLCQRKLPNNTTLKNFFFLWHCASLELVYLLHGDWLLT